MKMHYLKKKEEMKDATENNLEEFTDCQDEEIKQSTACTEIPENKIEVLNCKTDMKTKAEIQKISQEMKNNLDNDSLLDLQKRPVKAITTGLRLKKEPRLS